jgi:hypothetical protein
VVVADIDLVPGVGPLPPEELPLIRVNLRGMIFSKTGRICGRQATTIPTLI